MAARIGNYIHSDKCTPCKGGCLAKIVCQTDFAAKTPEFSAFANRVAMLAFGFQESDAKKLYEVVPSLHEEIRLLKESLKEKIWITEIVFLTVDKSDTARCDGSFVEKTKVQTESPCVNLDDALDKQFIAKKLIQ